MNQSLMNSELYIHTYKSNIYRLCQLVLMLKKSSNTVIQGIQYTFILSDFRCELLTFLPKKTIFTTVKILYIFVDPHVFVPFLGSCSYEDFSKGSSQNILKTSFNLKY